MACWSLPSGSLRKSVVSHYMRQPLGAGVGDRRCGNADAHSLPADSVTTKTAPLIRPGFTTHRRAHALGQRRDDEQPHARARRSIGSRPHGLMELLEQEIVTGRIDTRSAILNPDRYVSALLCGADRQDAPRRTVADAVAEKIVENLCQGSCVERGDQRAIRQIHVDPDVGGLGERLGPACGGQHMPSHILVGEARERPVLGGVRIEQPGRESEHRVDARSRLLQDDERQFRLPRCAPDGEIEQVAQPVEGDCAGHGR